MASRIQNNTLVYDAASATTHQTMINVMVAILFVTTTVSAGYVTISFDDGEYVRKFIIGEGVSGYVIDLLANSTLQSINILKKYVRVSFENGGSHPKADGTTEALTAATQGLVILQWKDMR